MAATVDTAAAKQAKQKKILIALSIVLVAVLAIQLPRMMGGSDAKPTATPADSTATAAAAASPTTAVPATATTTTAAAAVTGSGPSTSVAGVTVAAAGTVEAGTARLASFSLFEAKDPFVQQVVEEKPDAGTPAAGTGDAAKGDAAGTPASGSSGGTVKPAAPAMTYATVAVNGEVEQLEVKDVFPEDEPLFKLLALKPKSAKIGIAGGSLADGQFVTVALGKKVTLVNSATGARYTIELQYVGSEPEQIEGFATGEDGATTPATTTP